MKSFGFVAVVAIVAMVGVAILYIVMSNQNDALIEVPDEITIEAPGGG